MNLTGKFGYFIAIWVILPLCNGNHRINGDVSPQTQPVFVRSGLINDQKKPTAEKRNKRIHLLSLSFHLSKLYSLPFERLVSMTCFCVFLHRLSFHKRPLFFGCLWFRCNFVFFLTSVDPSGKNDAIVCGSVDLLPSLHECDGQKTHSHSKNPLESRKENNNNNEFSKIPTQIYKQSVRCAIMKVVI